MANQNNDLDASVQSAYRGNREIEEKAESQKTAGKRNSSVRLPTLIILLVLIVAYRQLVVVPDTVELHQDLHVSAIDLVMEADGSVYQYFQNRGELPVELPHLILRQIVDYEKIDDSTYSLHAQLPNVTGPVIMKSDEVISVAKIEESLIDP